MFSRFTDHPASVGETYFQHMAQAFGFGASMVVGGLACLVHGLFPWLCLTRGSDTVRLLHHRMVTHRMVTHRVVHSPRALPPREQTAAALPASALPTAALPTAD